jgi:hypothetical protein
VVVGRTLRENEDSRSFGFVRSIESNGAAVGRLKQRLSEQGPMADEVTVLSDGDPGL